MGKRQRIILLETWEECHECNRGAAISLSPQIRSGTAGPYHNLKSRDALAKAMSLGRQVLARVELIDEKTWRAPSPWHAAVWLLNLAGGAAEGKSVHPAPKSDAANPLKFSSALLFRGQRDPSWEVNPSLFRLTPDETPREVDAVQRFVVAMMVLTARTELPPMGYEAHVAVAQHYELRTHLLDMTVDPQVATYFACDGAADGDEVVVYWMPFDTAVNLGVRIVIPPPWVERIYRQHGLFLDFSLIDDRDIKAACYKILFPADKDYLAGFKDEETRLYPDHQWFKEACLWAKSSTIPVAYDSKMKALRIAAALCRAVGRPSFVIDSIIPVRLQKYPQLFESFLDWLVLKKRPDGNFVIDCLPVQILWRDNQGYVSHALHAIRLIHQLNLAPGKGSSMLARYAQGIHACLEAVGETSVGPAAMADFVLEVQDWFKVNEEKLEQDLLSFEQSSLFPAGLRVRLSASQFQSLWNVVQAQSERQSDPDIASQQRKELQRASARMERIELCAREMLVGLSVFYDLHSVAHSLRLFLEQSLILTVYDLASYQTEDGTVICREFRSWLPGDAAPPIIAQRVYSRPRLLEVFISPEPYPKAGVPYATVYLPPERLENDGLGNILTSIWESAEHIPEDVWIEYVVPQLVFGWMRGGENYTPWKPDTALYCTEGVLWFGSEQIFDPSSPISGTNIFLVPKEPG